MTTNLSLSIGEVAASTGISIRTLHYYEEIGLLAPVARTVSGHRRYDHDGIVRLQEIRSLQQIGLSLAEIGEALAGSDLLQIITRHQEQARARLREAQELDRRLTSLREAIDDDRAVSTREILHTLAVMTLVERHADPDRDDTVRQRHREIEAAAWRAMVNDLLAVIDQGVAPTTADARPVLERWLGTVGLLNDDGAAANRELLEMFRNDPEAAHAHGLDARTVDWLATAFAHHASDLTR